MIVTKKITFSYNRSRNILKDITFKASDGCIVAILGNNGAGKSTLLKCLNRIHQPKEGSIHVDSEDIKMLKRNDIARRMSFVEQHSDIGRLTVYDTVLLGRKPYIKINPTEKDYRIVENAIERMGLNDFVLRYVDELSGGELQKVILARALAQQPKVLLLDEPTSCLDLYNQYEVMRVIKRISKEDNIISIIVIHDINLALRFCDRFIFIKDGEVFSYGGEEIINSKNISAVYGIESNVEKINGVKVVVPK